MQRLEILHFSDLHLFVDPHGNLRAPRERATIIRAIVAACDKLKIPSLATGLYPHSDPVFRAFQTTIDELCASDQPSRIVVQSGDIEAFGFIGEAFDGHDFMSDRRTDWVEHSTKWIDVFGNHDVWPGTIPLIGEADTDYVERELRKRSEYSGTMPDVSTLRLPGDPPIRIEFYRLNSVCSDSARNFIALGKLNTDILLDGPYPLSNSVDPLNELRAQARQLQQKNDPAELPLRIVVLHHPPRSRVNFDGKLLESLTRAEPRFHVCLSGHTHKLDPGFGKPSKDGNALQLVTGTAARRLGANDEKHSFCLYSFIVAAQARVAVERTVFRIRTRLDARFVCEPPERIGKIQL